MAWPSLSLGNFDKIQRISRGVICKMTTLQFMKGPNAKMHLIMLISGSRYPKNIYNMSKIEVGVEIQFELEIKFKFGINQKRNGKRKGGKRKGEGPEPLGLA